MWIVDSEQSKLLGSSEGNTRLIIFWYTMQVTGGHVFLPILTATFAFTTTKRHVTLVNLCIIFVLTSIISCLLLYTNSFNGPPPNRALCFFQASSTNSLPPAWSTALMALCWYIWSDSHVSKGTTARDAVMVVTPYFVYFSFFITSAMIEALNPNVIIRSPRHIYCSVNNNTLGIVSGAYTAVATTTSISLTVHRCARLWLSYRYLKSRNVTDIVPADLNLVIRLAVFVVYTGIGLVFSLWTAISQPDPSLRDIYIATLSVALFLAFGTQQDVLHKWRSWIYRQPRQQPDRYTRPQLNSIYLGENSPREIPIPSPVVIISNTPSTMESLPPYRMTGN